MADILRLLKTVVNLSGALAGLPNLVEERKPNIQTQDTERYLFLATMALRIDSFGLQSPDFHSFARVDGLIERKRQIFHLLTNSYLESYEYQSGLSKQRVYAFARAVKSLERNIQKYRPGFSFIPGRSNWDIKDFFSMD